MSSLTFGGVLACVDGGVYSGTAGSGFIGVGRPTSSSAALFPLDVLVDSQDWMCEGLEQASS